MSEQRNDWPPREAVTAFHSHKRVAKHRGIPFEFTLQEWWEWWRVDDRWSRRGRGRDAFVMARRGDIGPYRADNVYCATHSENLRDIGIVKRRAAAAAGNAKAKEAGRPVGNPAFRKRGDGHPRSRPIVTPLARFGSARLAAEAHGISPSTVLQRIHKGAAGWHFA